MGIDKSKFKAPPPVFKEAPKKPIMLGGPKVRPMDRGQQVSRKPKHLLSLTGIMTRLKKLKIRFPDRFKPILKKLQATLNLNRLNRPTIRKVVGSINKLNWRSRKLQIIVSGVVITVVLIIVALVTLMGSENNKNQDTKVLGSSTQSSDGQDNVCPGGDEKPRFKLIFPRGKTAENFGGVCRTSPQTSAPAFRYFDYINNMLISVTEQEIPPSMKDNLETGMANLAQDFQANNIITIDGNKIYHGVKEKSNEQSLILSKNNLLVFIIAEQKLPDDTWVGYITNLQ